jgi:hypothetical protein
MDVCHTQYKTVRLNITMKTKLFALPSPILNYWAITWQFSILSNNSLQKYIPPHKEWQNKQLQNALHGKGA